jgi:hypothetical protein
LIIEKKIVASSKGDKLKKNMVEEIKREWIQAN